MNSLTKKERIIRQARGQEVDCVPTLGGWIMGVVNLANIARLSCDEFLQDPLKGTIQAYVNLNVDGLIQPVIPINLEQVRTDSILDRNYSGIEPEALLDYANKLPDSARVIIKNFDSKAEELRYRSYFEKAFEKWEGIIPIPNFWEIGGHFPLYTQFGYSAFLMACSLYPEAVGKIYWVKSLQSLQRAKILVRIYQEYDLIPLMFCGEDMCNNKGPMVSPDFLRKHYLPTVQMIIEPLVDNGIRLIHHCDGDIRPLIDDFIQIGFSGFQGFQYELGIDIHELMHLRSRMGEEIILFTGMSVSRTLPFGSFQDIHDEIDYFLASTDGGRGIFLITSNVSGVEVPFENLVEAYRYAKTCPLYGSQARNWKHWPWGLKNSELH